MARVKNNLGKCQRCRREWMYPKSIRTVQICDCGGVVEPFKEKQRSKFGNQKIELNGRRFDSKAEASRYQDLVLLQQLGKIANLECQPEYRIEIGHVLVCKYLGDFRYRDVATGDVVVEDVKGVRTEAFKLKKKLMRAVHGIDVQEVRVHSKGHRT